MDQFDERQAMVRGKIALHASILAIVLMLGAALINDFGIYAIEEKIGFSDFMIGASLILLGYLSTSCIIKDASFGLFSRLRTTMVISVFTALTVMVLGLLCFDIMRGESVGFVSICNTGMLLCITGSLWYMRKEWK